MFVSAKATVSQQTNGCELCFNDTYIYIYMYKAWVVVKKNPANIPKKPSRFEYLTMTKSSYLIYNTCIFIIFIFSIYNIHAHFVQSGGLSLYHICILAYELYVIHKFL